jgi:hypothetical protein
MPLTALDATPYHFLPPIPRFSTTDHAYMHVLSAAMRKRHAAVAGKKPGLEFGSTRVQLDPVSVPPVVRLKVSYKHPQSLIGELTRSIGLGAVALETRRAPSPGTRFIFELRAQGFPQAVEVEGEVLSVSKQTTDRFLVTIQYVQSIERAGLDALLESLEEQQRTERVREHPRIPIHIRATEDTPYSPAYRLTDLSLGGMGLEVEAPILPRAVRVGTPFLADLTLGRGVLALHGEVSWTTVAGSTQNWQHPRFGVRFGRLRDDARENLQAVLALKGLPPPPWKARVSFGMEAVSRMP